MGVNSLCICFWYQGGKFCFHFLFFINLKKKKIIGCVVCACGPWERHMLKILDFYIFFLIHAHLTLCKSLFCPSSSLLLSFYTTEPYIPVYHLFWAPVLPHLSFIIYLFLSSLVSYAVFHWFCCLADVANHDIFFINMVQAVRTPERSPAGVELLMEYYNQLNYLDKRFFSGRRNMPVYFHW